MLKKITLIAALILAPVAASATDLPDYPFIHVSGTGAQYALPDIGELDFEISAHDADPGVARKIVETRVAELRALVESLALADTDVEIRDIRKEMRKADPGHPGELLYDIKCGVHIKVTDLTKWRALVSPMIDMANMDGFMTGFDSSNREKIEAELTAEAIKVARRKAEAIAAGFGKKLGPVSAVSSGELKNLSRAMGLTGIEMRGRNVGRGDYDRNDLLMINIMKMAQSVDVIFRIK
jgi:uncharacterized protein YggE